ncbi:hypothetical protein P0W64_11085 [Tsukamurella sp. 8F]|uniref:DUF6670 family protein n=1 Tax=unclassified Tsukamurella TaxID=2633480 RepID=UPI0023B9E1B9|nr:MULTISPECIES: DUF6670 family protein [unclassified Tsukamurella]MDF0529915.1 hypothetical protein [Tsukamurella sp. 8J]MDF0587313.1 hypothetical protein [Tsukamurella sp. 8F]
MSTQPISRALSRLVVDGLLPRIDSRIDASRRPFDRADIIRPHSNGRLWAATHYGVFIPLLPEPYRYLNTMTFIGTTGTETFDNDYLAGGGDPRNLATVLSSTAAGDQHHYRGYSITDECSFTDHELRWGDDLTLRVDLPKVTVAGRYEAFSVDLELDVTDQVSYFVKTPVYDHISLFAPYRGTIADDSGATEISGLGTFEYARFGTHQAFFPRALPAPLKLPVDLFTYQIVEFGDTQILLTDVGARGYTACRLAQIRTRGGEADVLEDVTYEVLEWADPQRDPIGRTMRVPLVSRWTVRDAGAVVLELDCHNDAPWRYGHGRGYVTAYTYDGAYRGEAISGSGYMEWVDTRPEA